MAPAHPLSRSSIFFFLLGLTIFLYLPIRASQHPLINWGDPSHWRNFWRVVTRADYGGLKLHPEQSSFSWTARSVLAQLAYFAKALLGEWGWAALLAGAAGIFSGLRAPQARRRTAALLGAWLLSGPAFFLLSNLPLDQATTPAILQPYLLLSGLLWAPLAASGLASLPLRGVRPILSAVLVGGLLLAARPWAWSSERNDFFAYDYARNLLRSLPAGAVLYEPDDPTRFSIEALQLLENRRPDVVLLNFFRTRWGYEQIKRRWPDLLPPIPIDNAQQLQRLLWTYSARRRPFYAELPQKFGPVPYRAEGLVYAAENDAFPALAEASLARAEALLDIYVRRGDFLATRHADFFTRHLIDYYAAAHCNLGLAYARDKAWDRAVRHYQAALAIDPELPAAYNDWGIVAFERANYAQAADLFGKAAALDPKNESTSKNVQLALQKIGKLIK